MKPEVTSECDFRDSCCSSRAHEWWHPWMASQWETHGCTEEQFLQSLLPHTRRTVHGDSNQPTPGTGCPQQQVGLKESLSASLRGFETATPQRHKHHFSQWAGQWMHTRGLGNPLQQLPSERRRRCHWWGACEGCTLREAGCSAGQWELFRQRCSGGGGQAYQLWDHAGMLFLFRRRNKKIDG